MHKCSFCEEQEFLQGVWVQIALTCALHGADWLFPLFIDYFFKEQRILESVAPGAGLVPVLRSAIPGGSGSCSWSWRSRRFCHGSQTQLGCRCLRPSIAAVQ